MPRGIYSTITCKNKSHPPFEPTGHQKETLEYFMKTPFKGLLLYHKLGSGKTCTSIMIADKLLRKGKVRHVYVLTPGSLRAGWISEYCSICGTDSTTLRDNYTFITYNYMVGKSLPDFNGSLVIIDEVHNLVNGVKNFSQHPTMIYDALMNSDAKILGLSGTPIFNYVYEFSILGNLLKPGTFPDVRVGNKLDPFAFMGLFNVADDGTLLPKNNTKLKRMMDGIISYYPGAGYEYVPQVIEMPVIKAEMTYPQEINYWVQYFQEKKLQGPPKEYLKKKDRKKYDELLKLYVMAKKHVLTRSATNFYLPPDIKDVPNFPVSQGGWVEKSRFLDGALFKTYSTKFTALLVNIIMHINQKHVLFTFLKKRAGVNLIKSILGMCGIRAEVFSGDLDDAQRKNVLKVFNSEKNRYGDVIKILLVTEAGAEGISVLEARHMHILESSPRMSRIIQAIGRVARFKSHIKLPPEERNVKIWKYWSVPSKENITIHTTIKTREGDEEKVNIPINKSEFNKTVDETLYESGMKTMNAINSFLDLIKIVSVTSYQE
jgi:superfamily II DNA or RNA helicase